MVKNYSFLNAGLALIYNGKRYLSKRGLADLLEENITEEPLYPIIHLKEDASRSSLTHTSQVGGGLFIALSTDRILHREVRTSRPSRKP